MDSDLFDINFTFSLENLNKNREVLSLDKIKTHIQCVLDQTFVNPNKRKIEDFNSRFNFACPYCGDSTTDSFKKRGNLYFKNMSYKCFNCGIKMSLYSFIKEYKDKCNLNDVDLYAIRNFQSDVDFRNISTVRLNFLDLDDIRKYSLTKEKLKEYLGFTEINNTNCETFLLNRYQNNNNNFLYQPKTNSLVILNGIDDIIIGYQIRPLKQKKYFTYKLSTIYKECDLDINDSVSKLDNISSIFNILNINFDRNVTVFEGPMDSFLYDNSIALSGAHNVLDFEIENMQYWFDNDETGKKKAISKIKEGNKIFLWKKYLNDNSIMEHIKDLNDLIIYSKNNGIKLLPFDNYFSNNKLNIIHV